ncbi:MAG TPA: hypothetical protein VFV34_13855 [Blastocatellia bacterium]|nr:hypothetical protein [Blastocatellia bacterium]
MRLFSCCLAKDPRDRYGPATGVARDLIPTFASKDALLSRHDSTTTASPRVAW